MVAPEPTPMAQLAEAMSAKEVFVLEVSEDLMALYRGEDGDWEHGFELRWNAGGWRIHSVRSWVDLVGRFIVGSATSRPSQAVLKTLAVIVHRQPVSGSHISHIHGVDVDAVMCTLAARGPVEEAGESVSGARLYGTAHEFFEEMGFVPPDELISLAPYLPTGEELDELEELL